MTYRHYHRSRRPAPTVPPSIRKKRTKLVGPPNNIIELDHLDSTQIYEPEVVDVDAVTPPKVIRKEIIAATTYQAHDKLTWRNIETYLDDELVDFESERIDPE